MGRGYVVEDVYPGTDGITESGASAYNSRDGSQVNTATITFLSFV